MWPWGNILAVAFGVLAILFATLFGIYYRKYTHSCKKNESSWRAAQSRIAEAIESSPARQNDSIKKNSIKMAMAISTYIRPGDMLEARLAVFKQCISSFVASEFPGVLYVVDDGSTIKDHLAWARELNDPRIVIHEKAENGGIAKAKNTCIRLCLENPEVDYFFLSDDDVEFKTAHWYDCYMKAVQATNIPHFSLALAPFARKDSTMTIVNNYPILSTPIVNGCFLTGTRQLIQEVGYFKVLPYKYGHEHSNFSTRCRLLTGGFYDVYDSLDHIDAIPDSLIHHSTVINNEEIQANHHDAMSDMTVQPCIE